ncbi:hypothetical protein SISSUDRAFT_1040559 [Sistotremastrum suecicum HHB10207 ss-3]|uniref:mRNA decay factor PAT1 domain-containing protein n=1 Tax=Sistotremastrum suecicum HHB10207 ss-3 TaxID=1314776 RepID=A0A166HVL1_9AGAM|nr:hypothetical protein SISSUDRAFT_1040559 [Sistotremastrum suecicum HHB10207 ss-3]
MAFFGLPESQKYLEGGLHEDEDVAVYTWGEDGYDGLGDALVEGNDDFNDDTFGGSDPIGQDFDFQSGRKLEALERPAERTQTYQSHRDHHVPEQRLEPQKPQEQPKASTIESLWDNKSPFSVLPKFDSNRGAERPHLGSQGSAQSTDHGRTQSHPRIRTVEEIEAEMRAAAKQARSGASPSLPRAYAQPSDGHRPQPTSLEELERQMKQHNLNQLPRGSSPLTGFPTHVAQHSFAHQRGSDGRSSSGSISEAQLLQLQRLQLQQQQQQQQEALQQQMYRQRQVELAEMQGQIPLDYQQQQQALAQYQQSLLAQLKPDEFIQASSRSPQLSFDPEVQEAVRQKASRQIMEQEQLEGRRRRKAMKISRMSRYNDLMTQSDKDFITRIQVSQLVTADPYAEDFYAQVWSTLVRNRMGGGDTEGSVIKFGQNGGVGGGVPGQRGSGRRQNAIQRMEAQVERIISNARIREKEKGLHSIHSLQGALGKTSGRSYKAAPRQLLQVDAVAPSSPSLSHTQAQQHTREGSADFIAHTAKSSVHATTHQREPSPVEAEGHSDNKPLTRKQALMLIEGLYDLLLKIEHMRREQPAPEDLAGVDDWKNRRASLIDEVLHTLQTQVPLDACVPHPLISILAPAKGKRVIPRVLRHLDPRRQLGLLYAIVANFSQLDVVIDAHYLDTPQDSPERKEVERQTQLFITHVFQSYLPLLQDLTLQPIHEMTILLLERGNLVLLAKSRPGLHLLTFILSQVENFKQEIAEGSQRAGLPTSSELQSWQTLYDRLFHVLSSHLVDFFPSTRLAAAMPFGIDYYLDPNITDVLDLPVWRFLAAFAVHASMEQQQILVVRLREKVLDNVVSASKGTEIEYRRRLDNVDLFLHALGLDSSQINI